jgi:aromatic ring-opening dioxygenase LigB subunit
LQKQLSARKLSDCQHGEVVRLEDIVQSHPMSNNDHIIYEIHNILKSYYKLARKRFVDNMRKQVADHFLLIGPNTPLKLFSSKFVASLSPAKLEEVTSKEFGTKRQRADLKKDIGLLEKGIAILR